MGHVLMFSAAYAAQSEYLYVLSYCQGTPVKGLPARPLHFNSERWRQWSQRGPQPRGHVPSPRLGP